MQGGRSSRALGLIVVLGLLGAACGDSGPTMSSTSQPFLVGAPPSDGAPAYELASAGAGEANQSWGDDSTGTDEPFTVLAPRDGDVRDPRAVVVSVTGFEGYQGALDQASRAYATGARERFTIDGREAIYGPTSSARSADGPIGTDWADLVAVRGDDLAVRVQARHASRDEMIDVLRRTVPHADRGRAPAVPDPPAGLVVVGSVDVDVVLGLSAYAQTSSDAGPGPPGAHGVGWARAQDGGMSVLAIMTVPGSSAALDAIPGFRSAWLPPLTHRAASVAGRPAWVFEGAYGDASFTYRAVVTTTVRRDLLIAVAQGRPLPPTDQLLAFAASVRPATDAEWDAFVADVHARPRPRPETDVVVPAGR